MSTRPASEAGDPTAGLLSSVDMLPEASISYRQLDHWTRRGFLNPVVVLGDRWWPKAETEVARLMGRLTAVGLPLETAARVARSGQSRTEIAPGIWIEVTGSAVQPARQER